MRVALAAVLFSEPDLLLLDEPTNYLDLEGTLWLTDHLARYPRTVIVISHDRDLLDDAVDWILHIEDRKSTRLNSSHLVISYAVFCLKKKNPGLAKAESHSRPLRSRAGKLRSARLRDPPRYSSDIGGSRRDRERATCTAPAPSSDQLS